MSRNAYWTPYVLREALTRAASGELVRIALSDADSAASFRKALYRFRSRHGDDANEWQYLTMTLDGHVCILQKQDEPQVTFLTPEEA